MNDINKILLGTAQLGLSYGINNKIGKPSFESATEILKAAYQHGVCFLDTAEAYGNAHEIIGSFHVSNINKFHIITKLSEAPLQHHGDITKAVEADIKKLNIDKLYGFLFHSIELYQNFFDRRTFSALKEKNKIQKVGVSIYTNEQALMVAEDKDIDIVQLPFNLLDNMNLRGSVLQILKAKGKEVHVRSVFLQGLLFMQEDELPQKLKPLYRYIKDIHIICKQLNLSVQQLALSYVLQNDLIDKVLIGVESLPQLYDHINFLKSKAPSKSKLEKINSISVKEKELLIPTNW